MIIKVGNPVVSSEEIERESWFVQTHEFALFSQRSGTVEIPPFEVRYSSREGFTGPVNDRVATVPGGSVAIRRPPGSDQLGFLVTAKSVEIEETWEPLPGPAKPGDVFKRTITQQVDGMTGIALAPPPSVDSDGIRVYVGDPEIEDTTERGEFVGRRRDVITYVVQKPGTRTLPGITYVWWNPEEEELRSRTLPAVTFEVASPPPQAGGDAPVADAFPWGWWTAATASLLGIIAWRRESLIASLRVLWCAVNSPERVAARRLLRACRQNDAAAASRTWLSWLILQPTGVGLSAPLRAAAVDLQEHRYGPRPLDSWQGASMAHAFREQLATASRRPERSRVSDLPTLNPSS